MEDLSEIINLNHVPPSKARNEFPESIQNLKEWEFLALVILLVGVAVPTFSFRTTNIVQEDYFLSSRNFCSLLFAAQA